MRVQMVHGKVLVCARTFASIHSYAIRIERNRGLREEGLAI